MTQRPLWKCPRCGKRFARAGQKHSCGVVSLERHFEKRPLARALFDAFCAAVEEEGGPLLLSSARTRIGLLDQDGRLTFAAVMPRRRYLRAHILLRREVVSDRFVHVEHIAPYWVHVFEIHGETDIDGELRAWLRESYRAGRSRRSG